MSDRSGTSDGGRATADESDQVDRDPSADTQLYTPLAPIFTQPGPFDVLLGRGKGNQQHEGNQRFQTIVNEHRYRYKTFQTRDQKTNTTREIVNSIKTEGNQTGHFLKFDKSMGGWREVIDEVARVKVAQALRYKREDDGDSRGSARKKRSRKQQQSVQTSSPDTDSPLDPSSAAALLATDGDELLSNGVFLSDFECEEGSAGEPESDDQTETEEEDL
jgi:hypothetical protein